MSKTINLEEILRNKIGYMGNEPKLTKLVSERATGFDILSAMKEACKQTLELAAENAEIGEVHEVSESIHGGAGYTYCEINKQSILNTINQIE